MVDNYCFDSTHIFSTLLIEIFFNKQFSKSHAHVSVGLLYAKLPSSWWFFFPEQYVVEP